MNVKISSIITSTSLLLFCSVSVAALADGMPFEEPKPQQILTPIDKSLNNGAAQPVAAPAAQAEVPLPPVPESRVVDVQPNTSFFGLSVGEYDPFSRTGRSTAFNAEWQPGLKIVGTLQPLFGAMVTTKGSMLGYGGLGVPFNITDHVFLMPSVAVAAYKGGSDLDLGRNIVERIGTELAYQFDDKSRLGLNFDVLTNNMSLQHNERTEMVALTYTMPFSVPSSGAAEPEHAAVLTTTPPASVTVAPAPVVSAPTPAASAPAYVPAAPAPVAAAPSAPAPAPAAAPAPAPTPAPTPAPAEKPAPHELP